MTFRRRSSDGLVDLNFTISDAYNWLERSGSEVYPVHLIDKELLAKAIKEARAVDLGFKHDDPTRCPWDHKIQTIEYLKYLAYENVLMWAMKFGHKNTAVTYLTAE